MSDKKDTSLGDAHVRNRKKEQNDESHRLCVEAILAQTGSRVRKVRLSGGGYACIDFKSNPEQICLSRVNSKNQTIFTKIYVPQH